MAQPSPPAGRRLALLARRPLSATVDMTSPRATATVGSRALLVSSFMGDARATGRDLFLSVILLQVGLDPRRDVNWVEHPTPAAIRLLAEGKIDALLNFPPVPQELRARKIAHSILNSSIDRPWSQYFCCVVAAHRDFVSKHPVAAKRAIRAMTKAADVCALEPERTARFLVDKGYTEG
ncbi:MAG: ABC transporter substrate-binding protein [Candidatus Rokuibacteriota bacterium]